MYNVRGPSKIVAKTARRGISQNVDNFNRDNSKESYVNTVEIVSPKLIFHKKSSSIHHYHHNNYHHQKQQHIKQSQWIPPQHEEMINYVNDSWNSVYSELNNDTNETNSKSKMYSDEPCGAKLKNFKPFDLELWCERRLYEYVLGEFDNNNIKRG